MYLIYVLIIILISGTLDIIEKKASEKDELRFWAFGCLTFGIFETLLGIFLLNSNFSFSIKDLFLVLPISLLSTIGYYFSVLALKNGNISKVSVIMRLKIIWVLILSSIFLPSERLKILQIILVFIILLLNILLNYKKGRKGKDLGIIYSFGYLFSNGSATFINKLVTLKIENTMAITFYSGITTIFSIILILLLINKMDLLNLKKLNLNYVPIVIVTTHVNSKRTYEILHRNGVDLILYKDHPNYSCNQVLNKFINLIKIEIQSDIKNLEEELRESESKISEHIYHEFYLIGVTAKLKGRKYIHDAILYLIQNENSNINVIQHLTKIYKKSGNSITNGFKNEILHSWRVSSIEDLTKYYTAKVNY